MARPVTPISLPPGCWRLDPITRVMRYVYDEPMPQIPDAFDEPTEAELAPVMTGASGRRLAPIQHGKPAGARAHARRGEKPCDDCHRAQLDYRKSLRQKRAAEGDPRFACECGAPKSRRAKLCAPCEVRRRWSRVEKDAA